MSFEAPELLLTLLVVPLAAVGYWLLQRRPPRYAVRYTNLEVLAGVAGRRRAWRRHVPAALMLAALAALGVSLARPTVTVKAPNERASVVLVVDTSGSMRASDVKPTRLAAAKHAMHSFIEHAPSSLRVGIVSFAVEGQESPRVAARLSAEYGIGVRDGLFCAHPLTRHLLATASLPGTAVRASLGLGTTSDDVDRLVGALADIAADPAFG